MTTNTQRHTARPSRSRVSLARVIGWADSHSFGLTLGVACVIFVMMTASMGFAIRHDLGVAVRDSVLIAVLSALITIITLFFACSLASEYATKKTERVWRRIYSRSEVERALAVEQRNTARQERDEIAKRYDRMTASYEIVKVEHDALQEESANLQEESANLLSLIRSLVSPLWADSTRDDLRVWVMAGNSETAYARAFHNGEGVSLDDEITRREAYAILKEVTR